MFFCISLRVKSKGWMCHWCKSSSQSACANFWDIFALFLTPARRRQSEIASAPQRKINFAEPTPPGATELCAPVEKCQFFARYVGFLVPGASHLERVAKLRQINHIPGAHWWPSAWNCVFRADLFILLSGDIACLRRHRVKPTSSRLLC